MARGWKNNSAEDEPVMERKTAASLPSGAAQQEIAERAKRERARQELELQRERILSERTSNPLRRASLESALVEIEARLARLT